MNTPLFAGTFRRARWVLLAVLAVLVLTGCARKPLLEGLDERQANEVIAVLLRHNISAEKLNVGKGGFQVQVAARDLPESIELMQRNDLPSAPRSQVATSFPSGHTAVATTMKLAALNSAAISAVTRSHGSAIALSISTPSTPNSSARCCSRMAVFGSFTSIP